MKPSLRSALPDILKRAEATPRILVLLDFDGTLAPFEDRPDLVIIPQPALELLRRLAENPRVTVGIVSARSVTDLMARVEIEGIVYAGNHGLEIRGLGLHFNEPFASVQEPVLKSLLTELTVRLEQIPGVRIENKRLTASVNLRAVRPDRKLHTREVARSVVSEFSQFRCQPASEAFDIVPKNGWHKGKAVQWIRRELGLNDALAIFAGDDVSDEDAFAALPGAVTIKVGGLPTLASYRADSPSEIWTMLTQLEVALAPSRA